MAIGLTVPTGYRLALAARFLIKKTPHGLTFDRGQDREGLV
jgi:hypothetical protein